MGNATVGYGTDHHHEARMFAMRFTPNSHIAMVGNSNDVRGDTTTALMATGRSLTETWPR